MLHYTFEVVDMGEEVIAVPVGYGASSLGGVLKLNHEGIKIIELIQKNMTETEIIDSLSNQYDNSKEELSSFVHDFFVTLKDNKLMEE